MRFAVLFFCLSASTVFAQAITVEVGGRTVGSANTLNFKSDTGIIQACSPDTDPTTHQPRITCTPAADLAVLASRDAIHGDQNYCVSATHNATYACHIANTNLLSYSTGLTFVLYVDAPCPNQCSLNVDNVGAVSIKRSDGKTDPGGSLIAGQPQWVFYDGRVFRLMGGGSGTASVVTDDAGRDIIGRRFIAAMDNPQYQRTIAIEPTAGDMHRIVTSNGVGNATIAAGTAGLPGQHMWLIIANDQISPKTITFGANFRAAGPLTGTAGKSATMQFISDGTAWYEVARTTNL